MYEAVVFDLDGVLIDSEIEYLNLEYNGTRKYIENITIEELVPTIGMSMKMLDTFFYDLFNKYGVLDKLDQFNADRKASYDIDYKKLLNPNAVETLRKLKQMNYKVGLASSGDFNDIKNILDKCEIFEYFDVICSGDMFEESKPNPDIYLTTFAKLNLDGDKCLVVEDSDLGIEAAKRANANVVCKKDTRFNVDQSGADYYINDLSEIIKILAKQIKVVFFDNDGTLSDISTHRISDSTLNTLKLLREKGLKVILATGRGQGEIIESEIIDLSLFDGFVYLNGQYMMADGKKIVGYAFSEEQLLKFKQFIQKYNLPTVFFGFEYRYCNFINDDVVENMRVVGSPLPQIRNIDSVEKEKLYQINMILTEEKEKELLEFIPGITTSRWGANFIDIFTDNGGKDKGVKSIMDYYSVGPRECISFGDGENDVGMLKTTAIGVAMGNAVDVAKDAASYVTDSYNNEGIYKALKYFSILD